MRRVTALLLAASLGAAAPPPSPPEADLPAARELATPSSADCVSVHADGDPWDECGFQAFDMNADGSRILTVSSTGIVQLWDSAGRELKRIDWPDAPSGASGYPNGSARIVGGIGVAIVHQNQLVLVDLADGRELARRQTDLMMIDDLRRVGGTRLFASVREADWSVSVREILLPGGGLRPVPSMQDLGRLGPDYWMTGSRAPFTLVRADGRMMTSERSCMPLDAHYCIWRDIPAPRFICSTSRPAGGPNMIWAAVSTALRWCMCCAPPIASSR